MEALTISNDDLEMGLPAVNPASSAQTEGSDVEMKTENGSSVKTEEIPSQETPLVLFETKDIPNRPFFPIDEIPGEEYML
jgi:hypothetical protein